jgi:capping protein beta
MASYSSPVTAAFDLLRHVPPKDTEDRMFDIFDLNEELTDELISSVDIPLKIETDQETHQDFIKCDYNRDGDSYRSPFSNKYYPPLDDGQEIPAKLRALEELGNKAFGSYLNLYFGFGTLSLYCWEIDDNAFGLGVFVRKDLDDQEKKFKGSISCSDVFTITEQDGGKHEYQLVSSILLELEVEVEGRKEPVILSGGCADTHKKILPAKDNTEHLVNVGKMIEDNAADFMEHVKQIYVSKMSEILGYTKQISMGGAMGGMSPQDALAAAMKARLKK